MTSPQEQALPLPPPPLPPPNNPPPPTDNNPGNCCQTISGGGAHPVLAHTASSPALMRNANPSQAEHQQMLQSHVYVQSSSQPSPLRHGSAYTTSSKGPPSQCQRGHHNPDCASRSEMSYKQVAPPTVYCNSAPSPANSSSGYSSGTTQASHGSSFSRRVSNDGSDLPPPPPPPPKHTLIQSSAPPPPHIPPPVPPSNSNTDSKTHPGSQSNMYSMCRHGQAELLTIPHYY